MNQFQGDQTVDRWVVSLRFQGVTSRLDLSEREKVLVLDTDNLSREGYSQLLQLVESVLKK